MQVIKLFIKYRIVRLIRRCILEDVLILERYFLEKIQNRPSKLLPDIQSFSHKNTLTIHYLMQHCSSAIIFVKVHLKTCGIQIIANSVGIADDTSTLADDTG